MHTHTAAVEETPLSPQLHPSILEALAPFAKAPSARERMGLLIKAARSMAPLPDSARTQSNRVIGCTAQVWVTVSQDQGTGRLNFGGGSDSELSAGVVAVLANALSGLTPDEVLQLDKSAIMQQLALASLTTPAATAPPASDLPSPSSSATPPMTRSRAAAAANILEAMLLRARSLVREYPRFPSLLISAGDMPEQPQQQEPSNNGGAAAAAAAAASGGLTPQGAFAEAQAAYLEPNMAEVLALVHALSTKKIGVVAHFYMDPQVQGVLSSAAEHWPHIAISDSLVMADAAVKMAKGGCRAVCVLGVDFMSENVRAILDEAGHTDVQVYRMSPLSIGCSLSEAAESEDYIRYLTEASRTPNSLHVVYINTSLYTKAIADSLVPTITCTSSNVVQTTLQAFAQVPEATVWYGPDTYMGANLAQLLQWLAQMPDEEVQALHPAHTAASIRALLPRFKYFDNGSCIVHHIFGGEVCEIVREAYSDAYLTAHFEVPGEMFTLAMEAKGRGMGVVGSTSNILDFIALKVSDALARPHGERLKFVLGTESGMITSIVRKVQSLLRASGRRDVDVEIVFPVNPSAITTAQQQTSSRSSSRSESSNGASSSNSDGSDGSIHAVGGVELPTGLSVLPGPAMGEGCSLEGGCASCPYMRMNTLAALHTVCGMVEGGPEAQAALEAYKPKLYEQRLVEAGPAGAGEGSAQGRSIAQAGCTSILHMQDFQKGKRFSDKLVADIKARNAAAVQR